MIEDAAASFYFLFEINAFIFNYISPFQDRVFRGVEEQLGEGGGSLVIEGYVREEKLL